MASANTGVPLNTGAKIPAVGLGTWQSAPGEVKAAVSHALKSGYTHIDCAYVYGNETEVGEGLAEAFKNGTKREDIFITTKVWCTFHSRPEQCLDESLSALGLDYVDLLLVHWPVPMNPKGNDPKFPKLPDGSRDLDHSWSHIQTWKEMEKLVKTGKTKAIGVSNYSIKFLEELLPHADIVPAVNQVENHPYLPQQELRDYCKAKGIVIAAYSPLGSTGSPLFQEEELQKVAKKHGVNVGTILISYHVALGNTVLPKSVTPHRIEENLKVVQLDSTDLEQLQKISETKGVTRFVYPAFGVDLGFPDKK